MAAYGYIHSFRGGYIHSVGGGYIHSVGSGFIHSVGGGYIHLVGGGQCVLHGRNVSCMLSGAEVCALGAPRQNPTFFGIAHFKQPHPRIAGTFGAEVCTLGAPRQNQDTQRHFPGKVDG